MNFFHYVCNRLYSFLRYCREFHVFDFFFLIYMLFHFSKWNVIKTLLTQACIRTFPKFFTFGFKAQDGRNFKRTF